MTDTLDGMDVLPDCRATAGHGAIASPIGFMVPIYCANCGAVGGRVPEENMTFIFWLCTSCAVTYGEVAGLMLMPDELFWERLREEQLDTHGRYLTPEELQAEVEADASPLARLIKERRATLGG